MDGTFPALVEEPDGPFSRSARKIALRLAGSGIDTVQTFEYPEIRAGQAVVQAQHTAWDVAIQRPSGIRSDSVPPLESSRSMTRASGSITTTVNGYSYAHVILRRPIGLVITMTLHAERPELPSDMLELLWADIDTPQFDAASGWPSIICAQNPSRMRICQRTVRCQL